MQPHRRPTKLRLTEKQRGARVQFANKYRNITVNDLVIWQFNDESIVKVFLEPNNKNDVLWGSDNEHLPPGELVKHSAEIMVWGGMSGYSLTELHFIPQRQTITNGYYIDNTLACLVKDACGRKYRTGPVTKGKLFQKE